MAWQWSIPIPYHKEIYRFIKSRKQFQLIAAARRSRKSIVSHSKFLYPIACTSPPKGYTGLNVAFAPTFDQIKNGLWYPTLDKLSNNMQYVSKVDKQHYSIDFKFGHRLIFRSAETLKSAKRAEGVDFFSVLIDEAADVDPAILERTVKPAIANTNGIVYVVGVPRRRGVGAIWFRELISKWAEQDDADVFHWDYRGLVNEDYVERQRAVMDRVTFAEEFLADWTVVGDGVYYAFDKVLNVGDVVFDSNKPLLISNDFNVTPMTGVIGQYDAVTERLLIGDEIWLKNSNTYQMLDRLWHMYPRWPGGYLFTGDAAAKGRHTSNHIGITDLTIIQNDDRFKPVDEDKNHVKYFTAAPLVRDRINIVNTALCKANGNRELLISPRCKHTIEDLQMMSYKDNTSEFDLRDKLIGHISDALGYLCCLVKPLKYKYADEDGYYDEDDDF